MIRVLTIIAGVADIMAVATDVAMATIGVTTAEVMVITVAMTVVVMVAGAMAIIVAMMVVVMRGAVFLVLAVGDNAPSMGCPPIAAGDMAWLSRQSS
jgi:hypothetical protein